MPKNLKLQNRSKTTKTIFWLVNILATDWLTFSSNQCIQIFLWYFFHKNSKSPVFLNFQKKKISKPYLPFFVSLVTLSANGVAWFMLFWSVILVTFKIFQAFTKLKISRKNKSLSKEAVTYFKPSLSETKSLICVYLQFRPLKKPAGSHSITNNYVGD